MCGAGHTCHKPSGVSSISPINEILNIVPKVGGSPAGRKCVSNTGDSVWRSINRRGGYVFRREERKNIVDIEFSASPYKVRNTSGIRVGPCCREQSTLYIFGRRSAVFLKHESDCARHMRGRHARPLHHDIRSPVRISQKKIRTARIFRKSRHDPLARSSDVRLVNIFAKTAESSRAVTAEDRYVTCQRFRLVQG